MTLADHVWSEPLCCQWGERVLKTAAAGRYSDLRERIRVEIWGLLFSFRIGAKPPRKQEGKASWTRVLEAAIPEPDRTGEVFEPHEGVFGGGIRKPLSESHS